MHSEFSKMKLDAFINYTHTHLHLLFGKFHMAVVSRLGLVICCSASGYVVLIDCSTVLFLEESCILDLQICH